MSGPYQQVHQGVSATASWKLFPSLHNAVSSQVKANAVQCPALQGAALHAPFVTKTTRPGRLHTEPVAAAASVNYRLVAALGAEPCRLWPQIG